MNEVDAELTRRNLKTRIVFCCYTETTWPPETEKLNNPDRFTLLLGAISRKYFETISEELPDIEITKYERNNMSLLSTIDEYIVYAKEWQRRCGMSVITYEYHFYVNQYKAPDVLSYANTLYHDVHGYNKHGFLGMIEDGTQRCFFPNGINMYVYASTLFDLSCDFDELVEDYLSHAYGEDWREVKAFFEKIGEVFSPEYIMRPTPVDESKGKYYNPAEAAKMRNMKSVAAEFAPFIEAHKNMPMRAQTVAYKLLRYYMEYCTGLAHCLVLKSLGANEEAKEEFEKFYTDFGKYEIEIERYFDHFIMALVFVAHIFKIKKKTVKEDEGPAATQ
jgi:hypothetical protein